MRKYLRQIAKARMKAMGYPSPNRLMKKELAGNDHRRKG